MKITVWNSKGGVGKTTLSLNMALDFGSSIITNERYSLIDKLLPDGSFLKLQGEQPIPDLPDDFNVIFDFAGAFDSRILKALKQSDFVIVPSAPDKLDLQGTISSLAEITDHVPLNKIIVIINRIDKDEDFIRAQQLIQEFKSVNVFPIKKSRALQKITESNKSIHQQCAESGLKKHTLGKLGTQFKTLYTHMEI